MAKKAAAKPKSKAEPKPERGEDGLTKKQRVILSLASELGAAVDHFRRVEDRFIRKDRERREAKDELDKAKDALTEIAGQLSDAERGQLALFDGEGNPLVAKPAADPDKVDPSLPALTAAAQARAEQSGATLLAKVSVATPETAPKKRGFAAGWIEKLFGLGVKTVADLERLIRKSNEAGTDWKASVSGLGKKAGDTIEAMLVAFREENPIPAIEDVVAVKDAESGEPIDDDRVGPDGVYTKGFEKTVSASIRRTAKHEFAAQPIKGADGRYRCGYSFSVNHPDDGDAEKWSETRDPRATDVGFDERDDAIATAALRALALWASMTSDRARHGMADLLTWARKLRTKTVSIPKA
jgi:hypothetical protein